MYTFGARIESPRKHNVIISYGRLSGDADRNLTRGNPDHFFVFHEKNYYNCGHVALRRRALRGFTGLYAQCNLSSKFPFVFFR